MDPNLVLTHNRLNEAISCLASAHQFVEKKRPALETLRLVDEASVAIHDARTELQRFRAAVYDQAREEGLDEPDKELVAPLEPIQE